MPEEKDKKIHFKILTAEHLLEEKESELKKIEPPAKEEIKPEVIEKIEVEKEKIPEEPIVKEKIVLEPQSITGLYYPKEEPTTMERPKVPLAQPPLTPSLEEPTLAEMLLKSKPKEPKPAEKPKPEIIEEQKLEEPKVEQKPEEPKIFYEPPKPKVPPSPKEIEAKPPIKKAPILTYALLGGGVLTLIFLLIFLKPYERLKISKPPVVSLPQTETTTVITLPKVETTTETVITLPKIETTTESPLTTTEEIVPKKEEPIVSQPEAKEKLSQQTFLFPIKEISFVNNFSQKEVNLKELSFVEFEKQMENLLVKQELAGSLVNINFTFNNQKIPFNFVFDYFLQPSKVSQEKINDFKDEFTGNFAFMLYYSYTRKYPLLILEIKNPGKVKIFNENWEKTNMANDLKRLFLGLQPGKPLRNYFITKEENGLAYRIFYFDNNYKLIWTIADNFLIYSATENGLKSIASYLK